MNKKKLNSLEDLGQFVFSTNNHFNPEETTNKEEKLPNQKQYLEAHFSNKGRAGKTVTVIKGFVGTEAELKQLTKLLKTKCSVGGSCKNNEIIIQGNYRDKIITILKNEGYNVKRIGG